MADKRHPLNKYPDGKATAMLDQLCGTVRQAVRPVTEPRPADSSVASMLRRSDALLTGAPDGSGERLPRDTAEAWRTLFGK